MFKYIMILMLCLGFALIFINQAIGGWEFMFANKKYQKNIKIRCFLISETRVPEMIENKDRFAENIKLESYKELFNKKTYLAIFLNNAGNAGAWGELICVIDKQKVKISINHVPFQEWDIYIIPFATLTWNKSDAIPEIDVTWEKLFVK